MLDILIDGCSRNQQFYFSDCDLPGILKSTLQGLRPAAAGAHPHPPTQLPASINYTRNNGVQYSAVSKCESRMQGVVVRAVKPVWSVHVLEKGNSTPFELLYIV